jgi:DNA-directed RNA polymerase subunit RPC12/RpoP
MINIQYQCPNCEKIIKANIGQAIIDSRLKWYLSYVCNHCSSAVEMDDFGMPPNEIRQQIIEEEGKWKLIVNPTESKNKAKIVKIIRQALSLSIREASSLLNNFPNIISGTKVEMQWLGQLLSNENIKFSIEEKTTEARQAYPESNSTTATTQ